MTQDELKQKVAHAALHYIKDVSIVGVGTGSTVRHFIDYLAEFKSDIEGAVSSSEMTTAHSKKVGITCLVDVEGGKDLTPCTIFNAHELSLKEFAISISEKV